MYEMSHEVMNYVLQYLSSKPYKEVAGLINKLQEEFNKNEDKEKKEEPKKKK